MYVLCSECARLIDLRKMREARRKDKAEAKRAARGTTPAAERCASDRTGGEVMSATTELAPARSRAPSRAVRKRDERVRRVVRKIKKHALARPAAFRELALCVWRPLRSLRRFA